jgi:hypothetical protein
MTCTIAWKAACALIISGVLPVGIAEAAASFPAPLLGNSITVKWTANRQQKFDGSDEIVFRALSSSLQIYISTTGRAFSKESVFFSGPGDRSRGGRPVSGSFQDNRAPDDSADTGRTNIVHAEGGALVVDRQMVEGARRISITFDPAYGSCQARVILGREGGAGALRGKSAMNGQHFEVVSIDISPPSCSITPGNVFGGE